MIKLWMKNIFLLPFQSLRCHTLAMHVIRVLLLISALVLQTSCKNLKQLKPIQDRRELRNVEQGSVPEPFEPQIFVKDQTFVNGVGMRMIRVLAGSFQMGDATGKGYDDELPLRMVTLAGYHLAATEVTQAQWRSVMGKNPSNFRGENLPVETVNWGSAVEFCETLTEQEQAAGRLPEDFAYRLPTEAQWENACRAGTKGDYAIKLDTRVLHERGLLDGMNHPVGRKLPNAWGFHDMHGNVFEWCSDWYPGKL